MSETNTRLFNFCGFQLDVSARKLVDEKGHSQSLSSRAFDTLLLLVSRQGEVVTKQEILDAVWPGLVVEENNLTQAIFSLRKALGDSKNNSRFIMTVPGRGYCFIAPLVNADQADDVAILPASDATSAETTDNETLLQTPRTSVSRFKLTAPVALLTAFGLVMLLVVGYYVRPGQDPYSVAAADDAADLQAVLDNQDIGQIPDSVAVLPFTTYSDNPEYEIFVSALHDELIGQLTQLDTVNVISRQTVLNLLNGTEESPAEIGRMLGVESVLSGTLMELGNTTRVSMQLENPATGITLWSETFEYGEGAMAALDAEHQAIARQAASSLETRFRLLASQQSGAAEVSPEAWRLFLGARQAYQTFDIGRAWDLSSKAVALEPEYADALYYYSRSNAFISATPMPGMTVEDHLREHFQSAEKLYALEPRRLRSHRLRIMAALYSRSLSSVPGLIAEMQALDSGASVPLEAYIGVFYLMTGDFRRAIDTYTSRIDSEPLNLNTIALLMTAFEITGEADTADMYYQMGSELQNNWFGDNVGVLVSLGRGVVPVDTEGLDLSPQVKQVLASLNDSEPARTVLRELRDNSEYSPVDALYYSAASSYLGDTSLALDFLQASIESLGINFYFVWLPVFDEVRRQPEFVQILADSGVAEYWEKFGLPAMCKPDGAVLGCHPDRLSGN